jgi:hypothetical protein
MGVEATEQAANKAEEAAARPLRQGESDGDDGIIVPGTPLPPGSSSRIR